MTKFISDESVDAYITQVLRENHYEVVSVSESFPGVSDEEVLKIAVKENAILITEDKDFGELVFRLQKENKGILLIRLSGIESSRKGAIVLNSIKTNIDKLANSFTIIEYNFTRIRHYL